MKANIAVWSLLAASAFAQSSMMTIPVATGLSKPLAVTAPAGDPTRVFVVEQTGRIRVVRGGQLLATPFLDVSAIMSAPVGELGLFNLAFHPSYASNGRFFVFYTRLGDNAGVLAEYGVSPDPDVAATTGRVVLVVPPSTSGDHQGGCLQFALDGTLLVATGDGGSNAPGDPECDAQNGLSLLGKILRIDVDGALPYVIPPNNPFVGNASYRPEVWALGLRHPWRYSVDRATGDVYIADVGQALREEIDFVPAGLGGLNFGWNVQEGDLCTGYAACPGAPACAASALSSPVWTYWHTGGQCAVIGGVVYRGCRVPSLMGSYLFADYCARRIFSIDVLGGVATNFVDRTAQLAPVSGSISQITAFGEDARGEVYICDRVGKLWQIVPVDDCSILSYGTSTPNSSGAAASIGGTGSASICSGDLLLTAAGIPANMSCLVFFSANQLVTCPPFGNGTRCVGTPAQRMPIVTSSSTGTLAVPFGSAETTRYGITDLDIRYFQVWFRDPAAGGSMTNTTNGLAVVFCR